MTMQLAQPQTKRWTREEYYRLAEQGWFEGQRVQLIEGEIIQMPPQGHQHAKAIFLVSRWLNQLFGDSRWVRVQMPLNVGRASDPEPDIAVTHDPPETYTDHPQSALLVVEVADSSLPFDRRKAPLYASAGVNEYWILNLQDRQLEVHRQPIADPAVAGGYRYQEVLVLQPDQTIASLPFPDAKIRVTDLLN